MSTKLYGFLLRKNVFKKIKLTIKLNFDFSIKLIFGEGPYTSFVLKDTKTIL